MSFAFAVDNVMVGAGQSCATFDAIGSAP